MKRFMWAVMAAAFALSSPAAFAEKGPEKWIGTWGSSQYLAEGDNALPAGTTDITLRQIVRVSRGGERFKVRISNAFGTEPLTIGAVSVAPGTAGSARVDADAARVLSFSGRSAVTIPAGASYESDPVDLALKPLSDLAISLYLPKVPARQTGHPGSRTTSYRVSGNQVAVADFTNATAVDRWYHIAAIEVEAKKGAAIVTIGDSITDGRGSTTNGNDRWPDFLAKRLQADRKLKNLGVLNMGIGGNRILNDGSGPNAMARFERDVLSQAGVKYLIVLEGVNDLGTFTRDGATKDVISDEAREAHITQMITAYQQIIRRARAHGIKVYGATIMPYNGFDYYKQTPFSEADRQTVNTWIRTPGNFDGVIDFDAATRDPADPSRLKAEYDVGDHIHPSPAGFKAMAEAIDLKLFAK
ncbi:SGNH/GDSL hydrolase family protein [Asticcacaulis machinosus]|uniref:SGNH/GDSL hydrolase family protein n=1 Tax=Asticcacaulis machinosus TaxID=2984211 RepID=A0ABT5HGW5_9CAUL|nr:SGNH/GDSL hydrolase family protein [Asticcacaulis machinosus]MDC7675484.1 SGNH/GDSL hydrolase family protein [Asticcacaulis machinosus]